MKGEKGMGLIELIVGLALLATCIMGLNSLVISLIGGNLSSRLTDQATRLGETRINELRSTPFDELKLGATTDFWWPTSSGSRLAFQRTTLIEAGVFPTTRTVTVTVQWTDRGSRRIVMGSELVR